MKKLFTLLALIIFFILSLPAWEGSGRDISVWDNFLRMGIRFFPPDFSDRREIFQGLLETAQIGFLATAIAAIVSLFLAVLGGPWMPQAARLAIHFFFAFVRSIPSLVLAVLAVAVVGANPRAGVIALTLYSIGYLGKFLLDDFASLDQELMRTYRRWGLHPILAFWYGFWPQVKELYGSHCIWMLEYNIRSASILGYVGAGGLGLLLLSYQEYGNWSKFSAVLLVILFIVVLFELLRHGRERFRKKD